MGLKQCIKLHNGEPYNLYSSINIIRAIKLKVTWLEYSTRTRDMAIERPKDEGGGGYILNRVVCGLGFFKNCVI